jgi:signal transduction histidine kinase
VSTRDAATPPPEDYPRLLSLAAHELRTPASVVAGYIRMLQKDEGSALSERQRRILAEAAKSCDRLVAVVNELSDVGKLDSGSVGTVRKRFDLFPLVAEAVDAERPGPASGVEIALDGADRGAEVEGDPQRLRTALSTLLRTVLREQGADRVLVNRQLLTSPDGSSALVVFASAPEAALAPSAPRTRLDEGRGGLGLALPIARRIVEYHGGEIWSPAGGTGDAVRGVILVRLPCRASGR